VIRFTVKALATIVIVWILLKNIGLNAVLRHASGIDFHYLAIATLLGLILAIFAGLRWHCLIVAMGHKLGCIPALQITLIGTFFNQLLPSAMGGDLARIPYIHRAGLPLLQAVNSVVLDRVLALVSLELLVLLCLPASFSVVPELFAKWTLFSIAAVGLAGTAILLSIDYLPGLKSRHSVLDQLLVLSRLLRAALFGRQAIAIIGYGLTVHLTRILAVYTIAIGMMLDVTFYQSLILVPPAMLVTALPISVGGWGVREGAFVFAFGLIGIDPEKAFALSAVFGLTTMAAALVGGIFWIFHRKQPGSNQ